MTSIEATAQPPPLAAPVVEFPYDPARPVPIVPGRMSRAAANSRKNQRLRRRLILGTIRRLLAEHGLEGVTVRRIAETSGLAVQTIYNLVGPRDQAIVEAICEYTRYVGHTALPDPEDPNAVAEMIDCWLLSIEAAPQFCRQVSLIMFTPSRNIFYHFRDQQVKAMHGLLTRQQKCGVLRAEANVRDLSEQLVFLATALCLEWADRPFPLDQLHRRMRAGFANILAGAMCPAGGRLRLAQ